MSVREAGPRPEAAAVARELAAARQAEKRSRPAESLAHYQAALTLARTNAAAFAQVVDHLSAASKRSPNEAGLRQLLGAALLFRRDWRNAEKHLRKAIALAPRNAVALRMLGDCLMQAGKAEEALVAFREAVALAPQDRESRLKLAGLLAYSGERAEARQLYQALMAEGVRDPLACAGLIEVSDYSNAVEEPAEYRAALDLAEDVRLAPALRRMLHFSAARIDRARGLRDREFALYLRAKEHFPHRFDLAYFSELTGALKQAVTPAFFAERAGFSDKSRRPLLIFGMPRSGTTLSEQILAAHPDVAAGGELTFFTEVARQLGIGSRRTPESVPPERLVERIRSLDLRDARRFSARYNEELQWRGGGKIRVTDKMPGNFLHLWLIALLFAEGGYIHCVREPLATCFSCFTTDLGDAHSYTADFTTLAGYYQLYADLMRHWAEVLPVRNLHGAL